MKLNDTAIQEHEDENICIFQNNVHNFNSQKPQKRHSNLEVFLMQLGNETFKMLFEKLKHSNTSKEEWQEI